MDVKYATEKEILRTVGRVDVAPCEGCDKKFKRMFRITLKQLSFSLCGKCIETLYQKYKRVRK